jgi:hypothetical protein
MNFEFKEKRIIHVKGTFNITLTVEAPVAPLALASIEDLGTAGAAVTQGDTLPISGGTPPYKVTNIVGKIPDGVTIDAAGNISGTPTTPGSFPLTLDIQDSLG